MRTFGIWFFGLVASGIGGGLIGYSFSMIDGWLYGLIGGAAAFACGRLWSTSRRPS